VVALKEFKRAVVVFLMGEGMVNLAQKTRDIGVGLWNGYGGITRDGEPARDAAAREVLEECGVVVSPHDLELVAKLTVLRMREDSLQEPSLGTVYFFRAFRFVGAPQESEEMTRPTWFMLDDLPLHQMMLADSAFVPQALCGAKIVARAVYGAGERTLLRTVDWQEVSEFVSDE
jgi:8-oxo-dGTP diphosphatase